MSTKSTTYVIDAAGKKLGRVASGAAKALMGKTSVSYTRHILSDVQVSITNAAKLFLLEKKRQSKIYRTYSGHPGGLKKETLGSLVARKGKGMALRLAIQRMLPKNASRSARMKRLHISD